MQESLCSVTAVLYIVSVRLCISSACVTAHAYSLNIYVLVHMNEQHLTTPISNCHGRTAEKRPHTYSLAYSHSWSSSWCTTYYALQVVGCEATNVQQGNGPCKNRWGENALSLLSRKLNNVWGEHYKAGKTVVLCLYTGGDKWFLTAAQHHL